MLIRMINDVRRKRENNDNNRLYLLSENEREREKKFELFDSFFITLHPSMIDDIRVV
jgi:hypothetical protein